jgi:hypothetical protein
MPGALRVLGLQDASLCLCAVFTCGLHVLLLFLVCHSERQQRRTMRAVPHREPKRGVERERLEGCRARSHFNPTLGVRSN